MALLSFKKKFCARGKIKIICFQSKHWSFSLKKINLFCKIKYDRYKWMVIAKCELEKSLKILKIASPHQIAFYYIFDGKFSRFQSMSYIFSLSFFFWREKKNVIWYENAWRQYFVLPLIIGSNRRRQHILDYALRLSMHAIKWLKTASHDIHLA